MIRFRPANERGAADRGWLHSRFTFSFADYHDPEHMGFGHLRVINDDWIEPDSGFGLHPHQDMEIFTYVSEGQLTHADDQGNESVMRPGRVQLMRAGTGIYHSEHNRSTTDKTHLHQIWILPEETGLTPGYWEADFSDDDVKDSLYKLVGPTGSGAPLDIRQNATIYAARPSSGTRLSLPTDHGTHCWLQVLTGTGRLETADLDVVGGDGIAFEHESAVEFQATTDSEILLFIMN